MGESWEKLTELKEKYKENSEISNFLKTVPFNYEKTIEILYKVLSNDKLAQSINTEILRVIAENNDDTYETICGLVGATYGQDAEAILRERPNIKMRDIPNFYIFDEDIRGMVGYGGVHTFLTYYMESESIISEIAENKDLIRYYKEFEKITGDYFPPSAIGLEERLTKFKENLDLIKQIVDSEHPEQYAENFVLYLTDKQNFGLLTRKEEREIWLSRKKQQPTVCPGDDFGIETLEELGRYKEIREENLKKYIEQQKINIDDFISFKYFRMLTKFKFNYKHRKIFRRLSKI